MLRHHYQLKDRPLLDSMVFQTSHNFLAVKDESLLIYWDAPIILYRLHAFQDWSVFLDQDVHFFARDENHCELDALLWWCLDVLKLVFFFLCWYDHDAGASGADAGAGTVLLRQGGDLSLEGLRR